MFWKKKSADQPLVPHRIELNKMAEAVLIELGVDFDSSSKLIQALIGTYLFGMITSHGLSHQLTPPEVHALVLCVSKDTLHYTDGAAAEGAQACIEATKPGVHDTMYAIIHRGIDGHAAYVAGDINKTTADLQSILDHFAM